MTLTFHIQAGRNSSAWARLVILSQVVRNSSFLTADTIDGSYSRGKQSWSTSVYTTTVWLISRPLCIWMMCLYKYVARQSRSIFRCFSKGGSDLRHHAGGGSLGGDLFMGGRFEQ